MVRVAGKRAYQLSEKGATRHDAKLLQSAVAQVRGAIGAGKDLFGRKVRSTAALFRALDRDHEGSVDRAELIIALKRLGIAPVDAAVLLDAIDIHRTGKVELSELVAVISC